MPACFTQPRNVSGTTPTRGPIRSTTWFTGSDGSSALASVTRRCARSRSSSGYFLGCWHDPPSCGIRPSTNPGAVHGFELPADAITQIAEDTRNAKTARFGVRQIELYRNPEGEV